MSRAIVPHLVMMMLAANAWWLVVGSGMGPTDSLMPAGPPMVGGWILGGLSVSGGLATAALGAPVLAGRFSALPAMVLS